MKQQSNAVVNVIRPNLTDAEREERISEIKKAVVSYWLAFHKAKEAEKKCT